METNDIRNYDTKYIENIIQIKTNEDKYACLRFLTINNSLTSFRKYYDDNYINSTIDYSDCLIYFTK